jgi:hypothetical protein
MICPRCHPGVPSLERPQYRESATDSSSWEDSAHEAVFALRTYQPPARRVHQPAPIRNGAVVQADDSLAKMVNEEPVQTRDMVAMGQLRSIGIEKGKPFNPDPATRAILRRQASTTSASADGARMVSRCCDAAVARAD